MNAKQQAGLKYIDWELCMFVLLLFTTSQHHSSISLPYAPSRLILISHHSSSNTNNAASDQLLDLASDTGVLHVFLECGWVVLSLLEDRLHDWVLHNAKDLKCVSKRLALVMEKWDTTYLRILLDSLPSLLLRLILPRTIHS